MSRRRAKAGATPGSPRLWTPACHYRANTTVSWWSEGFARGGARRANTIRTLPVPGFLTAPRKPKLIALACAPAARRARREPCKLDDPAPASPRSSRRTEHRRERRRSAPSDGRCEKNILGRASAQLMGGKSRPRSAPGFVVSMRKTYWKSIKAARFAAPSGVPRRDLEAA